MKFGISVLAVAFAFGSSHRCKAQSSTEQLVLGEICCSMIRSEIGCGMSHAEVVLQMRRLNAVEILRPVDSIISEVEAMGVHSRYRYWLIGRSKVVTARFYSRLISISLDNEPIEKLTVWKSSPNVGCSKLFAEKEMRKRKCG